MEVLCVTSPVLRQRVPLLTVHLPESPGVKNLAHIRPARAELVISSWSESAATGKLANNAVRAIKGFAYRQQQFEQYLLTQGLRHIAGEPDGTELKTLLEDLEDLFARHEADNKRMRRSLDARRRTPRQHSEVYLSLGVHEATGVYHDGSVKLVLEELRESLGMRSRAPGTLEEAPGPMAKRWSELVAAPPE